MPIKFSAALFHEYLWPLMFSMPVVNAKLSESAGSPHYLVHVH